MAIWPFSIKSGQDTVNRARLGLQTLWTPSRDAPLKVTSGLINDGGGVVTVVGGTMDVSVTACRGIVQGTVSGTQGGYPVVLDSAGTVTLPNGGGGAVLYTIAILLEDSTFDLSGQQRARLVAYTTAGGPPVGSGVIPLREINLRAGVSVGTGGLLVGDLGTDLRRYTVAVGGVLPTLSSTRPGSPATGQWIYETDTGIARVWTGALWKAFRKDTLMVTDYLTASGNFAKTADLKVARARFWGPGGAGGGCIGAGAGQSEGGGGGGGGCCEKLYTDADLTASEAYVIGIGGAGASGANGNPGSAASTFKGLSAGPGGFGRVMTSSTTDSGANQGDGGTATGGDANWAGGDGGKGRRQGSFVMLHNYGGQAGGPGGGAMVAFTDFGTGNGRTGKGPGGGGSGSYSTNSSTTGGSGANGRGVIESVY